MIDPDRTSQANPALTVVRPGNVVLDARPAPVAAPGETLIRPDLVGLCGTDLEIIGGQVDPAFIRYPIVLGHEWTGIATGDSPLAGSRVVVEGIVACGHCARCVRGETNLCETYDELGFTRDGAATALVAVPSVLVHPIAAEVAAEDAVLTEPTSVVYRGLSRAGVGPGRRVLVIGDGTIALLAVYLLKLWSPAEVVLLGRREAQADLAATAGAARFETAADAAGGNYDLVIEAAGATAYTAAAWSDVVRLLNAGLITPGLLVTHKFGLADWAQAIACLRAGDGPRGKVLLDIGASSE